MDRYCQIFCWLDVVGLAMGIELHWWGVAALFAGFLLYDLTSAVIEELRPQKLQAGVLGEFVSSAFKPVPATEAHLDSFEDDRTKENCEKKFG